MLKVENIYSNINSGTDCNICTLAKEYDALYKGATYKESANLRIDIATTLSKLPLAYSLNNLSDISQTVMKMLKQ